MGSLAHCQAEDHSPILIRNMPDTNGTLGTATDLGTLSYYGIDVNNSVGGLIDSTTYDRADYFTFTAPEKGTYRFDIEALTSGFVGDVSARILNSNGDQIAQTYVYRPNSIDPHFRSLKFNAAKDEKLYAVIERFESNSEPAVDKTLVNYKLFLNSFNYHPNGVVLNDLKPTYKAGSTMTINGLYFNDPDGWQDIKSGTFDVYNKYASDLAVHDYSMTFTQWSGGNNWAQAGDVSLSLAGLPAGDYYAYVYGNDSKGDQTDPIYREFKIVENTVPSSILVYDLKDAYNTGDTIALTNLYVADADGWTDVANLKMDVYNASASKVINSSSFTQWSGGDTWAQGNLSLSLNGLQAGDYNVNFVATDKSGATTSLQKTIKINAVDATNNQNTDGTDGTTNVPNIQFSKATYTYIESEGRASIELTRSGTDLNTTSQVTLTNTGGTAANGTDYIDSQPVIVVTFNPGETTKQLSVQLLQDGLIETDEAINLSLSSPSGAKLGTQTTAQLAIRDDDTVASKTGGSADDVLEGDDQDNTLTGNAGNDSLLGYGGNDVLVGGMGDDKLQGGLGNDNLQGGDGNDVLFGGFGSDLLTGGTGRDQFAFNTGLPFSKASSGVAAIVDFIKAEDQIAISRKTFTTKRLTFASVQNVSQAKYSKATLTYVRKTGSLFYNQNGARQGFGKGGQFADLTNGLALAKSDLALIS